jgi:hypothetical protein
MPIFAIPESGVLVSRQMASGDLTSGSVMVGAISSGAISSGGLGSDWVSSGHIASGIYGGATVDYWKQVSDIPALLVSTVYISGEATRGYAGATIPTAGEADIGYNPAAKTVYCMPFIMSKNGTVAQIAIFVENAFTSGQTCQLGIYDSKSDLWPNNLLYSTASTLPLWSGNSRVSEGESWVLSGKMLYHLACIFSSGANGTIGGTISAPDIWGFDQNLTPNAIGAVSYSAPTSGTWLLPNPFPDTSGTLVLAATVPAVMVFF